MRQCCKKPCTSRFCPECGKEVNPGRLRELMGICGRIAKEHEALRDEWDAKLRAHVVIPEGATEEQRKEHEREQKRMQNLRDRAEEKRVAYDDYAKELAGVVNGPQGTTPYGR